MHYTEILETHFGKLIILNTDTNQGLYYKEHRKHIDQSHLDRLSAVVKDMPAPVIVDVGANLGWFSFELKHANPNSTVISFEPQRALYYMICGSIALNCFSNMFCHQLAIGDEDSVIPVPIFDYSLVSNYGGVEIDPQKNNKEYIGQTTSTYEAVSIRKLDSLNFERLDLLKIDVEGMEEKVLLGAIETIKKYKPIIFIEFLKSDVPSLRRQIENLGYEIRETLTENFLCFPVDR